ncbi:unnamed protein product [Paramecium primaurelia]|uniref:Uncharacterized protein n=1 Tax=Paramecium primaurelia TaxID=5886 RepID=A0A8S1KUJ8_PARPR|nr:unnamed protein product [Paramecium primaurelia]
MQNKSKAETNQNTIGLNPDGIFDLCDYFPVNDNDVCFEEYFWIENYILSPDQRYIAIFVRRNEVKIGSHSLKEYIIFILSLIDNEYIYYGEYIEEELEIQNYFFSANSKYLIQHKPTKLLYIKVLSKQNTRVKKISSESFLSSESSGNINLLINNTTILTIQLENDFQQIKQFEYEITFYQKLFSNFAIVESNDQTYIIHIQNQKILLSWNQQSPNIRYFWKSFIVQGQDYANKLRNLQTGKLIRNIHPKLGFRQFSQDQQSIYLFQIVERYPKIKKQKEKFQNIFSRFDILKGVYKQLNINIIPFQNLQTFNNDYYIDYEDVEEVENGADKIKRLRYFHISKLTK